MRIEKEMNEQISLEDFIEMIKGQYTSEAKASRVKELLPLILEILVSKGDVPTTFDGLFEYVDLEESDKEAFNLVLQKFADTNGYELLHNACMPTKYLAACPFIEDGSQICEYIFIKKEETE